MPTGIPPAHSRAISGAFEPEQQWINKVDGTKPGWKMPFLRSCGWSCAHGIRALAGGNSMMARERVCMERGAE